MRYPERRHIVERNDFRDLFAVMLQETAFVIDPRDVQKHIKAYAVFVNRLEQRIDTLRLRQVARLGGDAYAELALEPLLKLQKAGFVDIG
ncbi:hypothetical protein SDC9_162836 [bioreactor metagenome]|uniref:Uncharacterized protein n=1 Tax=bioreactor metagenome TaxID=1076179 RepID=A0A645FPJ1_9ZZZZ